MYLVRVLRSSARRPRPLCQGPRASAAPLLALAAGGKYVPVQYSIFGLPCFVDANYDYACLCGQ